jgi:uncharacterized protein HemY
VLLARLDQPKDAVQVKLPEPLLKEVREHVARVDREITDGYERQAVITFAGALLGRAGLWAESESLLKANLAKSHSPYYLMSQLGGNARKLGRVDEALNWYAQSFDKSEGPGHAAAVGLGIPGRPGGPGATGRGAHRKDSRPAAGRSGTRQRRL